MEKTLKEVKEEQKKLQVEIIKQMITLSTSGFGLVAALAWNNVVQEFVKQYVNKWLPKGGGLLSLLLYAIIITAFAVFVTYQLSKLLKSTEPTDSKK
jgi:hypothetical protein